MSTFGKYNIKPIGNNIYTIEWHEDNQYHSIDVDLLNKLNKMIDYEVVARKHFSQLFELAFNGDVTVFLNHPDHVIMDYIDENEGTPPKNLSDDELLEFNTKMFLLAYNRWKGTFLKYQDVIKLRCM